MEHLQNFIQQNYAKLKDLYLSMTLGNRIVAALLMATLLISLGYLIVGSIKATDPTRNTVKLLDGYRFSSSEKGAAEFAFAKVRLNGHNWLGDQLQVPTNRQADYTAALAENSVLESTGRDRFDASQKLSAWDAARTMDKRMLTAKERDCAAAIKKVTGIADAEVVSNKRPAWERNVWARTQITSVGVFVEAIENKPLKPDTIGAIGLIVAPMFGITNMKEISIVDRKYSRAYDGSGEQQGSAQSAFLRHQNTYQDEWENRIYDLLPNIVGLKVKTSVMLTTHREQRTFDVDHRKPTPLVTHVMGYDFLREGYDRFFRPGQIAQFSRTLIDPIGDISPRDRTTEKKHEAETTNALPGTETTTEELPYIPLQVRVSIQIPREHILAVWRENNRLFGDPDAKPTQEQLDAVETEITLTNKRSIAKLLESYRVSNKIDPMELVEIAYYSPIRPDEVTLTAWEQFVLFLQQHWQSLGLMSLVFGGLVVLWSISKPQKPEPIVIYEGLDTPLEAIDARIAEKRRLEEEAAAAAVIAAEEKAQAEYENSLGEFGSIRSLREEIAELIAKNPEAAAAVIRQWIGNAVLVEAKS